MIGRGAIRNPWIFDQIRQEQSGEAIVYPTGQDVLAYIQDLYDTLRYKTVSDEAHITRLKKYLNFIGLGIDPQGHFLHAIRQSRSEQHFFDTCRGFLNHFQGGIAAPIQDDDDLPPTPMVLGKKLGISGQGLANAVLFIVSRYQQGQAR